MKPMDGLAAGEGTSLNLLDESVATAMNEQGRIIRVDMFKGFTDAQKRRILQENEAILQDKRDAAMASRYEDGDWQLQRDALSRAMEMAQYEEKMMKDAQTSANLAVLKGQMGDQARKREEAQKQRYGAVSSEFFSSFGTSCR